MYTYARLYVYHVYLHIYMIMLYNGYSMVWLSQRGQAMSILYYLTYVSVLNIRYDLIVTTWSNHILWRCPICYTSLVLYSIYVIWLSQRGQITCLLMFIDDRDLMYMYIRDMCVVLGLPARRWRYPSYSVYVTLDTPVPFYARRLKPHYPFYP